jgi:YidC/Oxa1 family membrane protein insertase
LPSAQNSSTTIENKLVKLTINKGDILLKPWKFKGLKGSGELVKLIKDSNALLNVQLITSDNRTLNTKDFWTKLNRSWIWSGLTMRKAGKRVFRIQVCLKADDYMLDFDIQSQGLSIEYI